MAYKLRGDPRKWFGNSNLAIIEGKLTVQSVRHQIVTKCQISRFHLVPEQVQDRKGRRIERKGKKKRKKTDRQIGTASELIDVDYIICILVT